MLYLRIALAVFTLATISKAQEFASKAEEYLNAQFKRGHFMGSVLVARDGKILFEKGYGLANAEWNVPNTPQTKFRLGSISKQFTAAAILLLQEQGKLDLDLLGLFIEAKVYERTLPRAGAEAVAAR